MFALAAAKRRLSLAVHLLLLVVIAATLVTPAAGAVPPRERGAEGAATSTDTNPPTKTTTTRTKTATVWATETQTGTRTNHTPPHTPGSTATTARSRTAASTPSASAVFSYPLSGDSWVAGQPNVARWHPFEIAIDIWLHNADSALLEQDFALSSSLPPGTMTLVTADIGTALPGDNYTLLLTIAGNEAQRLAHSQMFSVHARGDSVLKTTNGGARRLSLGAEAVLCGVAVALVGSVA